jgi:Na+-transporting methylmalonyl-CoA/oxaloacetate decarboxylase gamma subunit
MKGTGFVFVVLMAPAIRLNAIGAVRLSAEPKHVGHDTKPE